ncbi:MAG: Fpg/Nei family DNA glycosylase [Candidatus Methylacidiphilales bacterium]
MPELAEVEYYRTQWNDGIGKTVQYVNVHSGLRLFRDSCDTTIQYHLAGRRFISSQASGKQMLFRFSGGFWLGIHLGMSGQLYTSGDGFYPGLHDHLVIGMSKIYLNFHDPRRFGRIRAQLSQNEPAWWHNRPRDLLSKEFTHDSLRHFLMVHSRSSLKVLLLRQDFFPGIGNWMADEICWRARLHPALSGKLSAEHAKLLWRTVRAVCRDALRVIGTNWKTPPDHWLFNRRWKNGGKCPRCETGLRREALAGRTTCWCPTCQM